MSRRRSASWPRSRRGRRTAEIVAHHLAAQGAVADVRGDVERGRALLQRLEEGAEREVRAAVLADHDCGDTLADGGEDGRSLANPPSWWLWVSMNPGARTSPLPSTTFSPAAGWRAPTASIRSPRMRTEAGTPGAPVPSTTVAPWMRRDGEAGSSAASTFASRGTRNRAAAGAMRRQALVIGPILEEGDAICPPDVSGRVESI